MHTRRVQWAWCMYDWANSAYPLVISTALFPVYWSIVARDTPASTQVTFAGIVWESASLYSLAVALSYAVTTLLVPMLSGIADWGGRKKFFLEFWCTLGAVACAALALFDRATLGLGLLAAILASVGFNASLVFYNAFLPEIAPPALHDRLSARGYIMGYIGSSLLLVGILVLLLQLHLLGITAHGEEAFVRIAPWAFVAVALWWRGFAQITLSIVPETQHTCRISLRTAIRNGITQLRHALQAVWSDGTIARFLLAYAAASMGVQAVILLASVFGKQELHIAESLLVGIILGVQLVASVGSWFCARLSELLGNTRALIAITLVWMGACTAAYWIATPLDFALLSAVIGFVLGGIQSQMRSTFSKLIAEHPEHASLFSLYDIAEKVGTTSGMATFSGVVALTGSLRVGALVLGGAFLLAALLLGSVHVHARRSCYAHITQPQRAR